MALTPEERSAISRANLAKAREVKRIKSASAASEGGPIPPDEAILPEDDLDPEEEVQCIYCSLEFRRKNLGEHQRAMHRGDIPSDSTPASAASAPPGTTVRSPRVGDQPGIPMKVRWNIRWMTDGYQCAKPGDRDTTRAGWRKMAPKDDPIPTCDICGEPMEKMFHVVEWDAPGDSPDFVQWGGVSCKVYPGRTNWLLDVFVGCLRDSIRSRGRDSTEPRQASDYSLIPFSKLPMTGFIRDDQGEIPLPASAEVPAIEPAAKT
jgi:hypothetical protein